MLRKLVRTGTKKAAAEEARRARQQETEERRDEPGVVTEGLEGKGKNK